MPIQLEEGFEDEEPVCLFTLAEITVRRSEGRPPKDFCIVGGVAGYLPCRPGEDLLPVYGEVPTPSATCTRPGTAARMEVYAERYRRRQSLHHPRDAGDSLRHAREIVVCPNGRPLVVAEVVETHEGPKRVA